ncbi:hypothetical protein [Desnuesiella massiliensis]|uniref:hypothetical protein n=1 Tax=Desnuesiella massiliensis TaxID=1650662 RepID=UPI0006E31C02|nr:hypothetical protein [Desnuesiella massiliensis]
MTACEQLKEEYLKEITTLINTWKENSSRLGKEGAKDEAILETIKVNVGDIFYKMFNISYNNSCKKVEADHVELNKLSKAYLAFFDKIPAPWKEKMVKDKQFNMMEEYYKEEIKLATADKLKNLFIEYYHRFYKEI